MVVAHGESFDWMFDDFQARKFKLKVLKNSVVDYYGYLINDQFYDDLGYARVLTITFSDQLNLLGSVDFEYVDVHTLLYQLCYVLEKTGLQLPINIACNIFQVDMDKGAGYTPFNQAYLSASIWQSENFQYGFCGTVLEEILKVFWCRIFQSQGEWWICRVRDLQKTPIYCCKFTYAGVYVSNSLLTPQLATTTGTQIFSPEIRKVAGSELEYLPDWKSRDLKVDYGLKPSLISGLNADAYWSDPVTHSAWDNQGGIWYHVGGTIDGFNKGFIKAYTSDRDFISTHLYIASPLANIYNDTDYVFKVTCGRNKAELNWLFPSECKVQLLLMVEGVEAYHYDDVGKEWKAEGFDVIEGIKFKEIDTSDIANNLVEYKIEVVAPPVDGQIKIVFYAPYRHTLGNNAYFYIGSVSFEKSDENENLPTGEISRVNIDSDAFYVPEEYSIKMNGGAVIRENGEGGFVQINTDRYFGTLALTEDLAVIDDDWWEIYDLSSEGTRKLKDWLLYHWKCQHAYPTKSLQASFVGDGILPTSILKLTEFENELYIWDDVEFDTKSGIWDGTWLLLRNTTGLKTGQTFESELIEWSISVKSASLIGTIVSSSGEENYKSGKETLIVGENTILYSTPFDDTDVDLDPLALVTADGEIVWLVPYWDSEVTEDRGFKVDTAFAGDMNYFARRKK